MIKKTYKDNGIHLKRCFHSVYIHSSHTHTYTQNTHAISYNFLIFIRFLLWFFSFFCVSHFRSLIFISRNVKRERYCARRESVPNENVKIKMLKHENRNKKNNITIRTERTPCEIACLLLSESKKTNKHSQF